ncbi:MAG: thioredoxin family protein [Bacilli bacterium]|nr:thioredoxin family protein [Bacilli bacterium]
MKVIKITAVWCSACLIMNNTWKKVLENYDIETIELDLDMNEDEVKKYQPGSILPVFIFMGGEGEIKRITGEVTYQELINIIEELGFSEKIS